MPVYQNYPDIGLNYSNSYNLSRNIRPQFEIDFTSMPNGAIPSTSNGSKTLDPVDIFDLSSFLGGTTASVTNGRLGSTPLSAVSVSCPIVETGFYFEVDILPPASSWSVEIVLFDSNAVLDGYGMVIDSTEGTMKVYSADSLRNDFVFYGTESVDTSSSDQSHILSFKWDGNRRFLATWRGRELLVQVPNPDPVNLFPLIMVESNVVKSFSGGASEYFTNLSPNGPDRGVVYGNISFSKDNISWPGTVAGYPDAEDDGGVSLNAAISSLNSEGLVPAFTFDYCTGAYSDQDFPGNLDAGQIRVGAATSDISKFESGATPATMGINLHLYFDFQSCINNVANDILDDISNNRVPFVIIGSLNIDNGFDTDEESLNSVFEDIFNEIGSECIVFFAFNPLPEETILSSGEDYLPEDWVIQQTYCKRKMRRMNAKNISLVSGHSRYFYNQTNEEIITYGEIIKDDYWSGGVWDFLMVLYHIDDDLSINPTPYLPETFLTTMGKAQEYAFSKNKKLMLTLSASDLDDSATPGDGDFADILPLIYDYCVNSAYQATPNAQIIALMYNEFFGELADPSDSLNAFIQLLLEPESVDSTVGIQQRSDILSLPTDEKLEAYGSAIAEIMSTYAGSIVFVWKFDRGVVDEADYLSLFAQLADSLDYSTRIFGPNVFLSARGEGYDQNYNGVSIDSRDIDILQNFIDEAEAATPSFRCDGIAFSGNFDPSDWPDVIDYVKSLTNLPVAVTDLESFDATPDNLAETRAKVEAVVTSLPSTDYVFIPSDENDFFSIPSPDYAGFQWRFEGSLTIPSPGALNARLILKAYSEDILGNSYTSLEGVSYSFEERTPISGTSLSLGNMEDGVYDLIIYGDVISSGNASLSVAFVADNFDEILVSDTIYLNYSDNSDLNEEVV